VPAGDLAAETGGAGMLETANEVDANWESQQELLASVSDAIDRLVVGDVDLLSRGGSCDMRDHRWGMVRQSMMGSWVQGRRQRRHWDGHDGRSVGHGR
jgi:hypothetical protein